jgi:DNA-binding Lrp family transcriptional regulator
MKAYMALSCKERACNRYVLDKLLELNLSKKNIFLLSGPFDLLLQFGQLKGLGEFIKKWFDPIRMITRNEPLVEKTLSLIVINEGPSFTEEPYAFVFLHTQPRNLEKVQKALLKIPQVMSADTVFGPYDVVCALRAEDSADLERTVSKIERKIPQIQGSKTATVASLYST